MIKCPHCGSTTVEEYETEYFEDSPDEVLVVRHYFCGGGCGLSYTGITAYKKDGEEEMEGVNYGTLSPLRKYRTG